MLEISDMDWAQYTQMNYAQNIRKDPVKAKKGPSQKNFGAKFAFSTIFY